MQAHGESKWPREIGAHLPVEANYIARCRPVGESLKSGPPQLKGLFSVRGMATDYGCAAKGMHPFRQVVEVLTIPIPL
jgi:hypothetical protein